MSVFSWRTISLVLEEYYLHSIAFYAPLFPFFWILWIYWIYLKILSAILIICILLLFYCFYYFKYWFVPTRLHHCNSDNSFISAFFFSFLYCLILLLFAFFFSLVCGYIYDNFYYCESAQILSLLGYFQALNTETVLVRCIPK